MTLSSGQLKDSAAPRFNGRAGCVLLDLEGDCLQRESLAGYRTAFAGMGVEATVCRPPTFFPSSLIVVPAAITISEALARSLSAAMRAGANLVLESAAAFRGREEFWAVRRALLEHWGLGIEFPVILRAKGEGLGRVPYVEFTWPMRAHIRDFDRVISVTAREEETIARIGDLKVGCWKQIGRGKLIFLGSLLGPSLRTADREAAAWLQRVVQYS